ncbi:hypothetical protein ACKI2N_002490 [Cupriavidus sp. 30B13]|uniref:hypothetical protein n=1 Tax=Cupriavidus sp. 30B13 TaxID=3384241 RepID=UPI003B8FE273
MTISGSQIWEAIKVFISVAVAIGGPFLTWWLARERAERHEIKAATAAIGVELTALKLDLANHYARKEDVKDSRQEVLEAVKSLAAKVDRIYDKLDNKADKT